jgi:hypothetical protein
VQAKGCPGFAVEINRYPRRRARSKVRRPCFPHPLDNKKDMCYSLDMKKTGVFFSAALSLCAVFVSCEQVSIVDYVNDHIIPAALWSIEVVGNEGDQGGGDWLFHG